MQDKFLKYFIIEDIAPESVKCGLVFNLQSFSKDYRKFFTG